ncbi:MAG TPA: helix-turn-helix domain-containing protein [Smithellaceae bacterium]|nr:helix-turn-helix domain-containing protein [Smithellaceae bacterium]
MRLSSGEVLQREYESRVNRVIDYVHRNYGENLNVSNLAGIACISKYHFQRIFQSVVGETVGDFIRRVRAHRAMSRLTVDLNKSVTEIALECGFSSSQNFAKIFKSYFGLTPSYVRAEYNWRSWSRKMIRLRQAHPDELDGPERYLYNVYFRKRRLSMTPLGETAPPPAVDIRRMPDLRVAYVRTIGYPDRDVMAANIKRLIQWARPNGYLTEGFKVLIVRWCDTEITPEHRWIHDACVTVPDQAKPDRWVGIQVIPGGAFAVHRCEVAPNTHSDAWFRLIVNWLIESDYQLDYRPFYQVYCNDPESHPQKHELLDMHLPVRPLYE